MKSKLNKFSEAMQSELEANVNKGNWEEFVNKKEIVGEFFYHFNKLEDSMLSENKERIKEHIADCANLLLMLGNSYGIY